MSDAGHLPGNLHGGLVSLDGEAIILDLVLHDGLSKLTDDRQLVSEIAIEGFKIVRQDDRGVAVGVGSDIAIIDVHHVRAFDEGVVEELVGRIKRVVNLEPARTFAQSPLDMDFASEVSRVATGAKKVSRGATGALAIYAISALLTS